MEGFGPRELSLHPRACLKCIVRPWYPSPTAWTHPLRLGALATLARRLWLTYLEFGYDLWVKVGAFLTVQLNLDKILPTGKILSISEHQILPNPHFALPGRRPHPGADAYGCHMSTPEGSSLWVQY